MATAWEAEFPNLKNENWQMTSRAALAHNCIAWAAGDTTKRWWPDPFGQLYWPTTIPRVVSVDNFVKLFEEHGYSLCADGALEPGFEKVVIYAKGSVRAVKHAAWQLDDGSWSSKLGQLEDINHDSPEGLTSVLYGEPVQFLKRPRKSSKTPVP